MSATNPTSASLPLAFSNIAVVGTGRMGESIFTDLLERPVALTWICRSGRQEVLAKSVEKRIRRLQRAGALDETSSAFRIANTVVTDDLAALSGCDLIIETIVEDVEAKAELFRQIDAVAPPDAVLVSNSSSIKPSRLCPSPERARNFAGLHYFYPVSFSGVVEIIKPTGCTQATADRLQAFSEATAKRALVLSEDGGGAFLLNKFCIYYHVESFRALEDGILGVREIDDLIRKRLFSMGTFEFHDNVGLDVALASLANYEEDMQYSDGIAQVRNILARYVEHGWHGHKSGRGFYAHGSGEPKVVEEPFARRELSAAERERYSHELVMRLAGAYINSGFEAVARGYCTLDDLEFSMQRYAGIGKGPLELARELGISQVRSALQDAWQKTGAEVFRPSALFESVH